MFTGYLIIFQPVYNWYELVEYVHGIGHVLARAKNRNELE